MINYQNCLCKSRQISNVCPLLLIKRQQQSTTTIGNTKNDFSETTTTCKDSQEWTQAKPFEEMPTLTTFQSLRHFLPGGKYKNLDAGQLLLAMKNDMGPIFKINGYLGRPDLVVSHNPEDFPILFRNEGIWPARPGLGGVRHHRSVYRADFFQGIGGLFGSQGQQWSSFRSVVNPFLLQPRNVSMYLDKMSQANKEFLKRIIAIRDPHTFEVPATFEEEINRWTFESVCIVAFDKQLGLINSNRDNPEALKLFGYLKDFFTHSVDVAFKPPIWKALTTKTFKKLMVAHDGIVDNADRLINEVIQRIEEDKRNGVPDKSESEKSVLEKMLKIDEKIATVLAVDLLIAGVDTTTSTFAALLLCLAKNPEQQAILRKEILKALPHKDSEFNEATFKNLPFLRACLKETLRLYTLVSGTARRLANDVILSGFRVPKGTQVSLITLFLLDNDAQYPRAKEFLPERWLRHNTRNECPEVNKGINPFIYIPFGHGPRACIGRRIAEMEIELATARLVRNFYIEFNYPTENAFKRFLTNVPNIPLKFKFTDVEY